MADKNVNCSACHSVSLRFLFLFACSVPQTSVGEERETGLTWL